MARTIHFPVYFSVLSLALLFSISNAQTLKNPVVKKIADGYVFVEGPAWVGDSALLFSDIPSNTINIWTEGGGARSYLNPSGNSNGLNVNKDGLLLMCQHGPRQLARLDNNGEITPLATHYEGKRLNSPNDLALHSDGSIFFTDPPYGLTNQDESSELGFNGIYRLSPSGELQLLDSSLHRPNGIAFSPDETLLYVTDSEERKIFVWEVVNDSLLKNKHEFAYQEPFGYTDGMKIDVEGFIYSTGPIGVWIYHPEGTVVDTIEVPGQTTNCAWGGENGDILFVTSGTQVFKISNSKE